MQKRTTSTLSITDTTTADMPAAPDSTTTDLLAAPGSTSADLLAAPDSTMADRPAASDSITSDLLAASESTSALEAADELQSDEAGRLETGGGLDERDELTPAELARLLPRGGGQRWSQRVPALYPVAVRYHRVRRRIEWMRSSTAYARDRRAVDLPVRVKRHKSLLLRQLGETEMWMQHNKVTNLKLACAQVDGVLIKPGETFSFNKLVGNATRRKGYVKGMRLSNGQAKPGIGGGICQLANLLHWMVLHSPLTVTQRSNHSFDPFPDKGRVLPWGVGCSIVYNYVDLQFRNDTDQTFQLRVGVGERYLEGEILAEESTSSSYRVFARGERFLRAGSEYFRRNEIWRTVIDRRTGSPIGEELIKENVALVKYMPTGVDVIDVDLRQYPPAS